jgi:hypothetical protein
MSRAAIDRLVYFMDRAFEEDPAHSLVANLGNVGAEDWLWRPPNDGRSIRELTYHAGVAKHLYANHTFGDRTWSFEGVLRSAPTTDGADEKDVVVVWMREGHRLLHDGLAALSDADLVRQQPAHWGAMYELQEIIALITAHDIYHAGEINYLRALSQRDGTWPWQPGATTP